MNLNLPTYSKDQAQDFSTKKLALISRDQGWLNLHEHVDIEGIKQFSESVKNKFERIVILGIGGSALGITALLKSLKPYYWNELTSEQRKNSPTIHILDNIDPDLIADFEASFNLSKALFIVITKSGTTPETLSQYYYFQKKYSKDQFVFITDPEVGLLREIATKENIPAFDVPPKIGGRFSVLTAVGLLPAALLGIDIEKLLKGAEQLKEQFFSSTTHAAYDLAFYQHQLYTTQNVNMTVLMPYSNKLFTIADWYRQLLAESIGKEVNRAGEQVNVGITPINALGVTDQHSQSQLYTEGPKDKLILTIKVENQQADSSKIEVTTSGFEFLNNVTFKQLLDTEHQATLDALTNYKTPNATLTIPEISEETIGELIMFFQLSVGLLGEFFNINAFDQPGVELSKKLTKEYLLKA